MKTIINERQKGLLIKNGKFIKMLDAGKYHTFGDKLVEVVSLHSPLQSDYCLNEALLKDENIAKQTVTVKVEDCQLALHYVNGNFTEALNCGEYTYWNIFDTHEFKMVSLENPEVSAEIPEYIFTQIPKIFYTKIEVAEFQKAIVYFNNKLEKVLDAGTYYFWKTDVKVEFRLVDTRLTQLNITGQEILTHDKVSVRINFVCNYRITDFVKIHTEIDDYEEQIHIACQLAMRDYVGKYRIDEILENKEQMSQYIFERLKVKENEFYVEFTDAGVKDIILPGEIRDIMNTVLVAEKRAQANVITRREEVASTRSLLNTAKLMDENKTLYKLKELEYIERICENVGNITVNGSQDLLTQLTTILKKE